MSTARTVVISGATSGIGEVAAQALAARGDRIVFIARDPVRAQALRQRLDAAGGAGHQAYFADLSDLSQTRRVAAEIAAAEPRIDVLINNAGAVFMGRQRTADGLAPSFALNHLSYFIVTLTLLARLRATPGARIVCTASRAHRFGHLDFDRLQIDGVRGYACSKLENLLFVRRLAQRLPDGPPVNAFHPGFVATRFADNTGPVWRALMRWRKRAHGRTPADGARTLLYLAQSDQGAQVTGRYFVDCAPHEPAPAARNDTDAQRLWEESVALAGIDLPA